LSTPDPNQQAGRSIASAANALLLTTRTIIRVMVVALVLWYGFSAFLWMIQKLTGVILLVVLSIFFAYLISPLVDLVRRPFGRAGHKHVMPRGIAIGIVYLVLFGSIILTISIATPILSDQFGQLTQQAPKYKEAVKNRALRFKDGYERRIPETARKRINDNVINKLDSLGETALPAVVNVLLTIVGYLPWLVLIPILTFFILKDVEIFRVLALRMFPSGRWRWRADDFFQDINKTLAAYTRAQLIACVLIGTVCGIGFKIIGLPYVLLLAVLAGLCEFVPLVGPLLVALIVIPIAGYYSFNKAIAALIFLFVLRIIHDYVTYPRIIGQGIHLHPLAVVLAILAGAELGGVAGIFLAIPVVALVSVAHENWVEHRGSGLIEEMLSVDTSDIPNPPLPDAGVTIASPPVGSQEWTTQVGEPDLAHPHVDTTEEDMMRHRPDLATGELKLPHED
jgi:predicted PurR-regulated permease PerM